MGEGRTYAEGESCCCRDAAAPSPNLCKMLEKKEPEPATGTGVALRLSPISGVVAAVTSLTPSDCQRGEHIVRHHRERGGL